MLTALENAYLYLLRVVVLAAATLALVGVILGLARSATLIADFAGSKPAAAEMPGGGLRDYIIEKRTQGVTVPDQPTANAPAAEVPGSIRAAANSIVNYERIRSGVTVDEAAAISLLMNKQSEMPDDAQGQYGDSVAALMASVERSKGTPLSLGTINDLLVWHADKFKSNAESIALRKQASQAQALQTLGVAAAGFGVFITLVFCFLIVKIERNLRLVHTISADGTTKLA